MSNSLFDPESARTTKMAPMTEELAQALASEEGGRLWLRRGVLAGVFVLAITAGLVWRAKHRPLPPAKYVTAAATVGDVFEKVQATGAVQPVLQVNVGAQVNGRVSQVFVDYNSQVKKGDVLAEIDAAVYGTQVAQGQANVVSQRAQVASAKAHTVEARLSYERTKRLYEQSLATRAALETARGAYDAAKATEESARATVGMGEAQLQAQKTNVGYTKIFSPVDGVVVTRSTDPGAMVIASYQSPTLFVIAQDLRKMRVLADIDEADVGRLKEQMDADAVVDAFPGESFHGIVQQVRFSPNNQAGVVTYSAVVEVANPDEKLRPGMTATITIRTREAKSVVRIPNAALRYRPSPPLGADGKPIAQPPEAPLAKGTGRVFVITSDKPGEEKAEPKVIAIGASDGIVTEVTDPSLKADTKVVTDELDFSKKKGGPF
ncbi:efflux RND transporter periplasmic adaptor subunit [Pendulispora rubella]|uniref:Efflux RND transporter periplasmic adaptor subunit n=1 Tax=Pendulispora rubella TaxID=2741070 RepID=A0ABZ2L9A1_9BACT